MKKFLRFIWRAGCLLLATFFLISCFTTVLSSSRFSYSIFFALLFPYLFAAVVVAGIINWFVNKKWAFVFFVLLLSGLYNFFHTVAISPFHSWQMRKETGNLRIMTWNVSDFVNPAPLDLPDAETRRNIYHTITEYQPDILCFQEYSNSLGDKGNPSEKHELDSLGYHYSVWSGDRVETTHFGPVQRGTAIFSKLPFAATDTLNIRRDWNPENVLCADIVFNSKLLRIATGHLQSYYLFPDSARGYSGRKTVAKKLYTYKKDVEVKIRDIESIHERQVKRIKSWLDTSSHPVIYCGDMNATPVMYSYQLLKGDWQDAFLQAGNGIGATFYHIVPTLRIDAMFTSKAFGVAQCTVVQRQLGDHYPVVADLSWTLPEK